jgi:hypothetical protein
MGKNISLEIGDPFGDYEKAKKSLEEISDIRKEAMLSLLCIMSMSKSLRKLGLSDEEVLDLNQQETESAKELEIACQEFQEALKAEQEAFITWNGYRNTVLAN